MNKASGLAVGVLVAALAGAGGYYYGNRAAAPHNSGGTSGAAGADSEGAVSHAKAEKKLLYYRNPMGLPDTSPTPKKDPMGMDYIAVYAGEVDEEPAAANQVRISTDKVQKLGVRTEPATLRTLDKVVRASGLVAPDERLLFTIAPKFEGYVERLLVNVTGQPVTKGQALLEVYSPELVSAQREYAIAMQGVKELSGADATAQGGMQQLAHASLQRLKNWDISEAQVQQLAQSGQATRTLTFRSPATGIVMEKKAVQGMRFMPGETLYQVADLSHVWVLADVAEQDIGQLKTGAKASVRINAYPDKTFNGVVTYIYPTLNAASRTVPVRVELANPGGLLKPAMFAQLELPVSAKGPVLTVPLSAVIDSGTRQVVLVQLDAGRFEPRSVKLGGRSDDVVEVLSGIKNGEQVVVSANFLIDAESNLKAALSGFGSTQNSPVALADKAQAATKTIVSSGHNASGKVLSVDAKDGSISISHGPVASLKWPAMTMEFKAANPSLLGALKPGTNVDFEFVERAAGEWVITAAKPSAAGLK